LWLHANQTVPPTQLTPVGIKGIFIE
jgi:hypothetical protein